MAKERLEIELVTEAKQAIRNLNEYVKATGKAVKSQQSHAKASEQAGQRVGKLTKLIKSYFIEMAAGIMIARRLIKTIGSLSKAYDEQIIADAKLTAALKATGRWTQTTENQLHNFAVEMQTTTGIADQLVISAAGIMTTFTQISTKTFPEAITLAADMSKMFGQDLQQSVIQLGTALNDPIMGVGRLKRIGISFSVEQKKSIELFMAQNDVMSAQRVILDELELEIGGTARAIGETYAGQIDVLKASFGDLKEQMGRTIAIGIKPMLPLALQMVENLKLWITETNNLKEAKRNLQKAQEGVITLTQLEILQAEQIIAYRELEKIKTRNLIQVADGLGGTYEELNAVGAELIKQQIEEIKWRQYSINGLLEAIRLRDEETTATDKQKKASDTNKKALNDLIDSTDEWANTVVLSGEALASYIEQLDLAAAGNEYLKPAIKEVGKEMEDLSELTTFFVDEYKNYAQLQIDETNRILAAEKALAEERIKNMQNYLALASNTFNQLTGLSDQYFTNQTIAMDNRYKTEKDAIDDWYTTQLAAIEANITDEEMKNTAIENLNTQLNEKRTEAEEDYNKERAKLLTKQAKEERRAALIAVAINTATAVSKVWGQTGIWGAIAQIAPMAMGIAQAAMILAQPIPKFAKGGSFTTSGPELIQVGDNPGGRERVTVTPESSAMGRMGDIHIVMPITFGTRMIKEEFQIALDKGDVIVPERMIASR